ncbi:unnamed protein product [Ilex paraguariensis]|uniref:Uncharacterized protein n=1 Tax=Ilex paraguariensis TaxID=185542 RepID=A0ABC8TSA6_9AQUA
MRGLLLNLSMWDSSQNFHCAAANSTASSFTGNIDLCSEPLLPCNPSHPSLSPSPSAQKPPNPFHNKSKKLLTLAIIVISIGSALFLLLLLIILIFCLKRTQKTKSLKTASPYSTVMLLTSTFCPGVVETTPSRTQMDLMNLPNSDQAPSLIYRSQKEGRNKQMGRETKGLSE